MDERMLAAAIGIASHQIGFVGFVGAVLESLKAADWMSNVADRKIVQCDAAELLQTIDGSKRQVPVHLATADGICVCVSLMVVATEDQNVDPIVVWLVVLQPLHQFGMIAY